MNKEFLKTGILYISGTKTSNNVKHGLHKINVKKKHKKALSKIIQKLQQDVCSKGLEKKLRGFQKRQLTRKVDEFFNLYKCHKKDKYKTSVYMSKPTFYKARITPTGDKLPLYNIDWTKEDTRIESNPIRRAKIKMLEHYNILPGSGPTRDAMISLL
ncbi:hypothetical protein ACFL0W_05450 [Nanoarchaeota archaeon]